MPVDRHKVSVGKMTSSNRQNMVLLYLGKKGTVSLMELFPKGCEVLPACFYGKMRFNAYITLFGETKIGCFCNMFLRL